MHPFKPRIYIFGGNSEWLNQAKLWLEKSGFEIRIDTQKEPDIKIMEQADLILVCSSLDDIRRQVPQNLRGKAIVLHAGGLEPPEPNTYRAVFHDGFYDIVDKPVNSFDLTMQIRKSLRELKYPGIE